MAATYVWHLGINWNSLGAEKSGNAPGHDGQKDGFLANGFTTGGDRGEQQVISPFTLEKDQTMIIYVMDITPKGQETKSVTSLQITSVDAETGDKKDFFPAQKNNPTSLENLTENNTVKRLDKYFNQDFKQYWVAGPFTLSDGKFLLSVVVKAENTDGDAGTWKVDPEVVVSDHSGL